MKLCYYGCGKEAKFYFPTVDKWCCSKHWQSCSSKKIIQTEEKARKISDKLKGKKKPPFTEEHRRKLSIQKIGNIPSNKLTLKRIIERYPVFYSNEHPRENLETKEIEVRCRNCSGWFSPTKSKLGNRICAVESETSHNLFLYCSEKCKYESPDFYKSLRSSLETKTEYKEYVRLVLIKTYRSIKKNSSKIENWKSKKEKEGYSLDHKYSIKEGFLNNIDPGIIGHYKNLEVILFKENSSKKTKCSITLDELLSKMEESEI